MAFAFDKKDVLLDRLTSSLRRHPEHWRWSDSKSYLVHSSGLKLWVYCGDANLWEPEIQFGFWGKRRLRAAFRRWRSVQGRVQWAQIEAKRIGDALVLLARAESSK